MFATVFKNVFTASRMSAPGIRDRVMLGLAARRQRQALARLDEARLHDIGLDRATAEAESRRPAWDVPSHWLK